MNRHLVRTPGQALGYVTDCNLATVCAMAGKKSAPKSEFKRQITIAQRAIDWMRTMDVDFSTTRAADVVNDYGGDVAEWAAQWAPKQSTG